MEITALEKLKENYPELAEEYSAMTKEQLLEQICAEVLDLHAMEERVSLFMSECTLNMSKTNYTPESIKALIAQKEERDIQEFCKDAYETHGYSGELIRYIMSNAGIK